MALLFEKYEKYLESIYVARAVWSVLLRNFEEKRVCIADSTRSHGFGIIWQYWHRLHFLKTYSYPFGDIGLGEFLVQYSCWSSAKRESIVQPSVYLTLIAPITAAL